MATLLLSSCNGSLPAWQFWREDDSTPDAVELRAWLPAQPGEEGQLLAAQLEGLTTVESGTPISVTLVATDTGGLDRVLRSEPSLDLFEVDLFRLPDLVEDGRLAPLSSSIAEMHPSLIDAATIDGEFYCLPKDVSVLGLFYNMDLFDEAGISYPSDNWTWTDLGSAAEAVSGLPTVRFTPFGLVLDDDVSRWLPFFIQAGGLLDSPVHDRTRTNGAAGEALAFYDGLLTDAFAIQPEYFRSNWGGPVFGNGRVGMAIEGNWLAPFLDAEFPNTRYGVAPLPSGPAGSGTVAFGSCYAVSADSENQAAALAVIESLVSEAAMRERLSISPAIPARTSVAADWEAQYPQLGALRAQLDGASVWQARGAAGQLLPELRRLLQDVVAGDQTIEEALDDLDFD